MMGCAPDAWNSQQQAGFGKWLDGVVAQCGRMPTGDGTLGEALQGLGAAAADGSYYLDQTSRLFYGKITPESYRSSVAAFAVSSAEGRAAADCVIAQLPQGAAPR